VEGKTRLECAQQEKGNGKQPDRNWWQIKADRKQRRMID